MKRLRRDSPIKAAFFISITVATVGTMVVGGCGGTSVTTPAPSDTCPSATPPDGASCSTFAEDLSCVYQGGHSGPCPSGADYALCGADGFWSVEREQVICDPTAPQCPAQLPHTGDACPGGTGVGIGLPQTCTYLVQTSCGEQVVRVDCTSVRDHGEIWLVTAPSCEGTPDACQSYDHPDVCSADEACRYLTPGCADDQEPTAPTGCFPAEDCSDDTPCADGESCASVTYDPCPVIPGQASCGACGAEARICLPVP